MVPALPRPNRLTPDFLTLSKIRINAYQTHLAARTYHHSNRDKEHGQLLAPSTVNVKMAAVRSLVHSAPQPAGFRKLTRSRF